VRWSIDVRAAVSAEARGEDDGFVWRRARAVFAEEEQLVSSTHSGDRDGDGERAS
jgi:hypothetical protein